MKPSYFLTLGFPYCSVFGECWHEMTAIVYLEALVHLGDEWQMLTPEQVRKAVGDGLTSRERSGIGSILSDDTRITRVSDKLSSEENVRKFCLSWSKLQ